MLESKAEPADWEEEKTHLEKQVSSYQKSLSEANRIANNNYAYAENMERWFLVVGITAGIFFVIILVLIWIHFFEYEQADLWGQLFLSDNSEGSDLIVQIGQSAPFWEGAFSCVGSHVSCLQDPSENAHL